MTISADLGMSELDAYHHAALFATDRLAQAMRTEDHETIAAVLADAKSIHVPAGAPDLMDTLLLGAVLQIDPDGPGLRERVAWSLDIDAINDVPAHQRASAGYAGSGGYGGTEENTYGVGFGKKASA
jgi:hypothetical protein